MPLFTSSSNENKYWLSSLIISMLIFFIIVGGWEYYVRKHQVIHPVSNTYERWAKQRIRAGELGRCAFILVGASRLQMAIDLDVLKERMGLEPVQLSNIGGHFIGMLEELSNDDSITGTVLISVEPGRLITTMSNNVWHERFKNQINNKRSEMFYQPLEDEINLFLDDFFAYRSEGAKPLDIFLNEKLNQYAFMDYRRRVYADFDLVDKELVYQRKVDQYEKALKLPLDLAMMPDIKRRIVLAVNKIKQRGGNVILYRPPSTKKILELEQSRLPREMFWQPLVDDANTHSIHFKNHHKLLNFKLADGVHLDYRDAKLFTSQLVHIINSLDVLPADRCKDSAKSSQ